MLLTATFYVAELYAIVSVSDKTRREAKKCPVLLHKIKHSCTDPDILNAIELYSLQMYHNKLELTVCGLFPIDHTLLYTIAGAVTTYLIFLVQFSTSSFNIYAKHESNNTLI
ncbi:Gustatory receptor 28b [Carabus blaptoides fortunei]